MATAPAKVLVAVDEVATYAVAVGVEVAVRAEELVHAVSMPAVPEPEIVPPPAPTQTPLMAKHPVVRLMPLPAKVLVPEPFTLSACVKVVVPLIPLVSIEKEVEVEFSESEDVPILNIPSIFEKSQCLRFVPFPVPVIAKYGVALATCSVQFGVVVPNPMLPLLVVIAGPMPD